MSDTTFGPVGWAPDRLSSLIGKTYVITCANAGAGFQATRILLSKGAKVIMMNCSISKSNTAIETLKEEFGSEVDVQLIHMDISNLASVRAAAREALAIVPQVDVLICNSAIAQVPSQRLTVDGFESQLGTNHYGHFVLCGMLFDRIEESAGRIVVVASLSYTLWIKTIQFDDMNWDANYSANPVYSQSKLAQMMFAYEFQDRIKASGKSTKVLVCHPGSSATSLISTGGGVLTRVVWWLMTKSPLVQSAEKGAYPEVMCATETGLAERALHGPTGRMGFVGPVGKGHLAPHTYDKAVMQKLWSVSEEATGYRWAQ